eukprot:TRINITY_DN2279_c0_g1_i1.p1 TRINITY_DN2279_c0_g1~~TRINITY_DN2279_c0_g1_i1.p1  ORF type:complete len:588 (-),score=158.16 TRINITY_DN2279_c0_g1_i1:109-1872(-)
MSKKKLKELKFFFNLDTYEPLNMTQNQMWTHDYAPNTLKEVIGHDGPKKRVIAFLKKYIERKVQPKDPKMILLSGAPGIGKTTTALLACKELNLTPLHFNASDVRSKNAIKDVVSTSVRSQNFLSFLDTKTPKNTNRIQKCLILDEIDGMSSGDRGGLQAVSDISKDCPVPIICIANDVSSQKMRDFKKKCDHIPFRKPSSGAIAIGLQRIVKKMKIQLDKPSLEELAVKANCDFRQCLNSLQMHSTGASDFAEKNVTFQVDHAIQRLMTQIGYSTENLASRLGHYFIDPDMVPLYVHQNLPNVLPLNSRNNKEIILDKYVEALDSICEGDLIDSVKRQTMNFGLSQGIGLMTATLPGDIMRGQMIGKMDFPTILGFISKSNKRLRLLNQLHIEHRQIGTSSKKDFIESTIFALRLKVYNPLVVKKKLGIDESVDFCINNNIMAEDLEFITELSKYPGVKEPVVMPAVKKAFENEMSIKSRGSGDPDRDFEMLLEMPKGIKPKRQKKEPTKKKNTDAKNRKTLPKKNTLKKAEKQLKKEPIILINDDDFDDDDQDVIFEEDHENDEPKKLKKRTTKKPKKFKKQVLF